MYTDKLTSDDGKSNIKAACPLYLRASEYTTTRTKTAARKTTWDLNANACNTRPIDLKLSPTIMGGWWV